MPYTPVRLSPKVYAFACLMEERLRANDHKGGWSDETDFYLLSGVQRETEELRQALATDPTPDRVGHEAADTANFLMMLADTNKALTENPRANKTGACSICGTNFIFIPENMPEPGSVLTCHGCRERLVRGTLKQVSDALCPPRRCGCCLKIRAILDAEPMAPR